MNKLVFKIFSIFTIVVDMVAIILFMLSLFITKFKITTFSKLQFVVVIVALAVNVAFALYTAFLLIKNHIKMSK